MGQKKISISISDAASRWQPERDREQADAGRLRQFVQTGIDSGPGRYGSIDAIKDAARKLP